jgi:putative transposase
MPRSLRFAPPGLFLHITQRGNYRQRVFFRDADRFRYLNLVDRYSAERQVTIAGYCLMSNHVHLLACGEREGAISEFMKCVSGEFARYQHGRLDRKGRFWEGRFYSCALDESHLTTVLRYIERNPMRAAIVEHAAEYPWSSAGAHLGQCSYPSWLDGPAFSSRWTRDQWNSLLTENHTRGQLAAIRFATQLGRPLADEQIVRDLERQWNVTLLPVNGRGRPRKQPGRHELPQTESSLLAGSSCS